MAGDEAEKGTRKELVAFLKTSFRIGYHVAQADLILTE